MRIKEAIGRAAMLLAVLLLGWPAAVRADERAPAVAAPRPAIWLIEDHDTKIYLFGTTHVFAADLQWRSPALDRVIAEAQELVMETPDASRADVDPARLLAPMDMGKSINVLERVSPAARQNLSNALDATGMPREYFDRMHTWAVAFLLTSFQVAQGGGEDEALTALSGAEEQLGALFRARKRPISGVETMEQQIGFFSTMTIGAQRRFLEATVTPAAASADAGDEAAAPGDVTANAWVSGNVDAIAAEMKAMPEELYELLLTRRNRNWVTWLQRRMERPGVVLFAVGAGHLAGPDSVQAMLAEHGIVARRID